MKQILGILVKDDETGEVSLMPVNLTARQPVSGKIVKQPTPDEAKIAKEQKEDYSLDGRINKHKEVSKEGL